MSSDGKPLSRRGLVSLGVALVAGAVALGSGAFAGGASDAAAAAREPLPASATAQTLTVVKSPTCICCGKWVEHAREFGFTVEVQEVADVAPTKRQLGVPVEATSCHTTTAGGYAFEGHVPADLIARVLVERPDIAGLAAPGMPQSSPGMDAGGPHEPYEVMQFTRDGRMTLYALR